MIDRGVLETLAFFEQLLPVAQSIRARDQEGSTVDIHPATGEVGLIPTIEKRLSALLLDQDCRNSAISISDLAKAIESAATFGMSR